MLSLDPATKQVILNALVVNERICLAIVFGSAASGRLRRDSDLDIAVEADATLTATERMDLISRIAAKSGRPVDLVDLRTVGEPLLGQILKGGVRILGDNTRYAALIRKHLFDEADFMPYRRRILRERRRAWIGI
jgi:predicted nucleotidyltransferase